MDHTADSGGLRAEALERVALDAMDDMVRILSPEGRVLLTSASYVSCFGNQLGNSCHEMYETDRKCGECIYKRALETRETCQTKKRYRNRVYLISASPIFDEAGENSGVVEVFRDITWQTEQQRRLQDQNRRLLQDAQTASKLQRELFATQLPDNVGVETISRYLPAQSLGGDLFGCTCVNGKVLFYIADVSGHGMSAAMISLLISNIILNYAQQGMTDPASILSAARKYFCMLTDDIQLYVTALVGLIDPEGGTLDWANAGHSVPPLIYHNGEIDVLTDPSFPICNWDASIQYQTHRLAMEAGARLLVYTDGLIDPRSSSLTLELLKTFFYEEEDELFLDILSSYARDDREDDICMLLLRCKQ